MRITTPEQRARLSEAQRTLRTATRTYERATKAADAAREAQYRAIFEADQAGMRQVDITEETRTSDRPRGFTREHVRRIVERVAKELQAELAAQDDEQIEQDTNEEGVAAAVYRQAV
jgi:hypothetical protein